MEIIRGKIAKAQKIVLYGPEGIGKSTFAASFPRAVFIDTEGSTNTMDVARLPAPTSWQMLMNEVDAVRIDPSICGALVIDTADWAERMCIEDVCAKNRLTGIEDMPYGKAYTYVAEQFGKLLNLLEEVTRKGVYTILTAHAMMRKFEQPDELGAYDRWELKLTKKIAPIVKEWADMLLFANYRTHVSVTKDGKRKASGNERVIYTEHHACWDAKNRHGMPDTLPFEYAQIAPYLKIEGTSPQEQKTETPPPEPVQKTAEPKPETAPASDPPKAAIDYTGCPKALIDLMMPDAITPFEVQTAVASKGYYPLETPISVYDNSFVIGCLIGAWPAVREIIINNRKNMPF